jgi:hypothetical protein
VKRLPPTIAQQFKYFSEHLSCNLSPILHYKPQRTVAANKIILFGNILIAYGKRAALLVLLALYC